MKIIIFLVLIVQVFGGTSKKVSPSERGVLDTLLAAPSRLCLCRCGFPNREVRSVDIKVDETKVEVNLNLKKDSDTKVVPPSVEATDEQIEVAVVPDVGSNSKTFKGQTKLIGGDVPSTHVFPWLVLVMAKENIVAGGALISDNHVITSASPISKEVSYDVKVRLSVHDRCVGDVTSSNVSVEALVVHPAYSPASRAHDIALLRLANSLRFDRRLHPICLPNPRTVYAGEVATIVSWLSPTPTGGKPYCEPHRIRQPILPDDECSKAVTSAPLLTADKSCIGVVGSNSLLCSGDVGAPIQVLNTSGKYELVGIMTDVNVCGQTNATLFTKVSDHLNWISQVTTSDCLCRI